MTSKASAVSELAHSLDYTFKDITLLETALRHRSAGYPNNERLEFLGDAVLGAVIAEHLFERFPDGHEGQLTRLRSSLVKRDTLAKLARRFALGQYLTLGDGERKSAGWRRASTLENTMEAVFGAVYLDSDFATVRSLILRVYGENLTNLTLDHVEKDPKTQLQEYCQARKYDLPEYQVLSTSGKSHEQTFVVSCTCACLPTPVQAEGSSRRRAEQSAARLVLDFIEQEKSA